MQPSDPVLERPPSGREPPQGWTAAIARFFHFEEFIAGVYFRPHPQSPAG
jgi:hypothetical protein